MTGDNSENWPLAIVITLMAICFLCLIGSILYFGFKYGLPA